MPAQRKYFRILALLLSVPFLMTGAWAAQPQGGGEGGPRGGEGRRGPMSPDDRLKQLTKDFNLTSDQQAKIKPILVDSQKKTDDLRNESNGDRQDWQDRRAKMQKIMDDTNTQIRAQLDDQQKEKFDKQEQERAQRMQNRRGGMRGPGGDNPGGPPPPQN